MSTGRVRSESLLSRWGTRWRLTAVVVAAVMFALLSLVTFILVRRTILEEERYHALDSTRAAARQLDSWLQKKGEVLSQVGLIAEELDGNDEALAKELRTLVRGDVDLLDVFFWRPGQKLVTGSGWLPAESARPADQPWYTAARTRGGRGVTEPYQDPRTGRSIISVSRTVFRSSGGLYGVAVLNLKLTAAARHIMLSHFSESRVLVLDRSGHIVMDTRHGATAVVDAAGQPKLSQTISNQLRQVLIGPAEEGFFRDTPPGDVSGRKDLVAFTRLPSTGWTVAAYLTPVLLSRQFGLFVRGWLFMSVGTVLALLLITMVFIDRLLLPIERLFRLTRESRFMNTEVAANEDLLVLTRSVNRLMAYIEAFPGVLNLMLGLKDGYTSYHTRAVALYAVEIGKELGLTERQLGELECAALLHDIGKAGVPDGILKKPAGLTDDEWAAIRLHPVIGAEVASEAGFAPVITHAIRQHHERLDGTGYPDRLSGNDIQFYARIIAVADSYHAMTSNRPYRPAKGSDVALDELLHLADVKYDQRVVEAFAAVLSRLPNGHAEQLDTGISELSPA